MPAALLSLMTMRRPAVLSVVGGILQTRFEPVAVVKAVLSDSFDNFEFAVFVVVVICKVAFEVFDPAPPAPPPEARFNLDRLASVAVATGHIEELEFEELGAGLAYSFSKDLTTCLSARGTGSPSLMKL
jgi:hypothetical protein